ncbi:hypothetical protein BCR35DRAFT_334551 [Leucosporidium creatinivorum]|uniref:F-box domain-containing protein n=1 Tax=Leucosporidium creatinivorum TaxID=106004 RepID=A0A1Y2E5U0_9BASI|nr:hypothetical protein BCR35DRAFT_334551 [Leucosporidium creatinivorum]
MRGRSTSTRGSGSRGRGSGYRGTARRGGFETSPLESKLKLLSLSTSTKCPPLPSDVVYLILRHAAPVKEGPYELSYEARKRLAFLRRASLVCSVWRTEAQAFLWEHVVLCSNDQMKSFLLSVDKDRHTITLRLGVEQPSLLLPLDGALAQKVLAGCRGVRSVELQSIVGLPPQSFSAASLEDLKSLVIEQSVEFEISKSTSIETHALPFALNYPRYVSPRSWTEVPLPLLASLLLSVDKTASLDLKMKDELYNTHDIPFAESDHPVVHLTMSAYGEDVLVALLPFARSAVHLETLTIDLHPNFFFEALPHPLTTLAISEPTNLNWGSVVVLLEQNLASLSELKRLEVVSEAQVSQVNTLQSLCSKRGVVLDVAEPEDPIIVEDPYSPYTSSDCPPPSEDEYYGSGSYGNWWDPYRW